MVQRFDAVEEPARVGEHVVAHVGERDIAHTECGELAQCAERVAELVAPVRTWRAVTGRMTPRRDETDPSIPMSAAILPRRTALMTSLAVSASSNVYSINSHRA